MHKQKNHHSTGPPRAPTPPSLPTNRPLTFFVVSAFAAPISSSTVAGGGEPRPLQQALAVVEQLHVLDHRDPVDLAVYGVGREVGRGEVRSGRAEQVVERHQLPGTDEVVAHLTFEDVRRCRAEQGGRRAWRCSCRFPHRDPRLAEFRGVTLRGPLGAGLAVVVVPLRELRLAGTDQDRVAIGSRQQFSEDDQPARPAEERPPIGHRGRGLHAIAR